RFDRVGDPLELIEAAHLAQHLERSLRLDFVDLRDGEADVDDDVVPDVDVRRDIGQADLAAGTTEVDDAAGKSAGIANLDHLPRNTQTHGMALRRVARMAGSRRPVVATSQHTGFDARVSEEK